MDIYIYIYTLYVYVYVFHPETPEVMPCPGVG